METKNLNKFGFTACVDEKATSKLYPYQKIETALNTKLNLLNYTDNLNEIVFVYIALSPDLQIREEDFSRFRRKNKIVEIGVNLNYFNLLQADEEKTLELLTETYLKGIEKYLIGRKDFDGNKFYADMKQLFTENGILK